MSPPLFRPGDRPWLHVLLLALTLLSTWWTYVSSFGGGLWNAALYAGSVVAILGAHEMGHYLLARWHQVDTSLPYFIPLPMAGAGTLGAVIRIRQRIPHKNALVDIGAAGPLAGVLVALPILYFGILHSPVVDMPQTSGEFPAAGSLWWLFGELGSLLRYWLTGSPPMETAQTATHFYTVYGDSLLIRGLEWLALGPLPEGKTLLSHPMLLAGWFGVLVTMLNLMPIGQLDGGHLSFAVFGGRARWVGKAVAAVMVFLCLFYSAGWLLWLVVTAKVIGFRHPDVLEPEAPLSRSRTLVCALCLVTFVLCAMPVPLSMVSAP